MLTNASSRARGGDMTTALCIALAALYAWLWWPVAVVVRKIVGEVLGRGKGK